MTPVHFTVAHSFAASTDQLWAALIDWEGHGKWIPATRMDIGPDGARAVGDGFTAYTGYGPLMLVDRMRVAKMEWNEVDGRGRCEVEKLGPVLTGAAGFDVLPDPMGSRIEWFEQVSVPYVPGFLGRPISWVSSAGFSLAMRRLAMVLAS